MKPDIAPQALLDTIDADTMLREVQDWAAINTGTANIDGLDRMAGTLADAFSVLPGDVELVDPATVTAISAEGREFEKPHGRHMVLRVRPDAERRFVLTGHMDTVFPVDHPFQEVSWIDDDTINGPGTADMKGGLNIILHALKAFETMECAQRVGYDVMINSDEETGSLASRALIEELARGKYAALTYEPSALPDGTLAHARGGTGNYSITFTGKSAHAGRNPHDGRNAIVAASDLVLRIKALEADDITVNPAKMEGGSANNVVPDLAILRFNIRPKSTDAMNRFDGQLDAALAAIEADQFARLCILCTVPRVLHSAADGWRICPLCAEPHTWHDGSKREEVCHALFDVCDDARPQCMRFRCGARNARGECGGSGPPRKPSAR